MYFYNKFFLLFIIGYEVIESKIDYPKVFSIEAV